MCKETTQRNNLAANIYVVHGITFSDLLHFFAEHCLLEYSKHPVKWKFPI
uniref:Uncharacterized protein n=1 Tax=Arundo donax TaxID=35708 RepID=A0A0A9B5S4_ARUDO